MCGRPRTGPHPINRSTAPHDLLQSLKGILVTTRCLLIDVAG